ncbi:MAG TPA: S9 family peptidase, partial [Rheinheimera sp.]
MPQIRYSVLAVAFCTLTLAGPLQAKNTEALNYPTEPVSVPVVYNADPAVKLSLEQIMADPDWLGRQPEEAHWSLDSQQVYFERKRERSELRDWYSRPLADAGNGTLVPLSQLHQIGSAQISYNADRSMQAYVFEGDVFVRRVTDGELTQLTRDNAAQNSPEFLLDGRLVYREGWSWYTHDLATGQRIELV